MSAYGNIDFKHFGMSKVGVSPTDAPRRETSMSERITSENILLLQRTHFYWDAMYDMRQRRKRNRMFHRGDQLKDIVFDPNDDTFQSEEDYLKKKGKQPLKQNQVRQLVKNVVGQFLTDTNKVAVISRGREASKVGEMLTNTMQYALESNQARRIDTRAFEEFLLSGAAFQKVRYKYMPRLSREELFLENRPIPNMFVNDNIKDPRLTDMDFVGEFYDVPLSTLQAAFSKDKEDAARLARMYSHVLPRDKGGTAYNQMFTPKNTDNLDFYNPAESHLCRVFEIWQRLVEPRLRCHDWLKGKKYTVTVDKQETIDAINERRILEGVRQGFPAEEVPLIEYKERMEEFWYVKYLTPYGHVIHESETVYEHKEHPYSILLYPLIDGEVWGFVEDIIDQQKYINRLIMLMDFIIGSSAKGVLLVPEEAIPDDMDIDDIADEWTKFNGVIKIKLKHGAKPPEQITSSASIAGVNELLALQLGFMEDISGVSPSMQGQRAPSGTPARLYAQETANASLNTKDYFEVFNFFLRDRNWKALKTIIQFYDTDRKIALAGANYSEEAMTYNAQMAQDAEVDVIMTKAADSPAYRGIIEESLQNFVNGGLIDLEMYLKNSSLPFADQLLADVVSRREAMVEQGAMDPALMEQVGAGLEAQGADATQADPKAVAMLQQFMAGQAA